MNPDVFPSDARSTLGGLAVGPACVCGVAAIGWILVRLIGGHVNGRELATAGAICLVSYLVGMLPILLGGQSGVQTGRDPVRQFQFAWAGTLLHLATAAALAIVTILVMRPGNGFVFWLLGMFWGTLAGLCAVTIGYLRTRGVCLSNMPPAPSPNAIGGATIEPA